MQRRVLLKIKPDGSGTIEDTQFASVTNIDKKFTTESGTVALTASIRRTLPTVDEVREKAKRYRALELTDADEIKDKDYPGQRVKYKFKDITQIQLGEFLFSDEASDLKASFSHFQDGRAMLQLNFSDMKVKPLASPVDADGKLDEATQRAFLDIYRRQLKGAKFVFEIEVKGKIVKVDGATQSDGKSRISVINVELDDILKPETAGTKPTQVLDELGKFRQLLSSMKELRLEFVK